MMSELISKPMTIMMVGALSIISSIKEAIFNASPTNRISPIIDKKEFSAVYKPMK
jgi:hypothetical protein